MSRRSNFIGVNSDANQVGTHDMGYRKLMTADLGRLDVAVMQECVPRDIINLDLQSLVTTAPNVAPLTGKFKMNLAAFFVPNRVVWKDWNNYITGLGNFTIPFFSTEKLEELFNDPDFDTEQHAYFSNFGLDSSRSYHYWQGTNKQFWSMSLLPFRAYTRIWWDWYRPSNIIPDSSESSYIYNNSTSESLDWYYFPKFACYSKDFLTNNLRTIAGDTRTLPTTSTLENDVNNVGALAYQKASNTVGPKTASFQDVANTVNGTHAIPIYGGSTATGGPANNVQALRAGVALQNWLERANVLGGRVIDRIRGMFGSSVSAETLQMSEYLGSSSFDVKTEVSSADESTSIGDPSATEYNAFGTTDPSESNMKGQLAGKSTMSNGGLANIKYHVKEHGYFFVISWIMPDMMVTEGLDRHWTRGVSGVGASRYDFFDSSFEQIGFEPLLMQEVVQPYANMTDTGTAYGNYTPYTVLGYRGKYESYKYNRDQVCGAFTDPRTRNSMKNWVLRRDLLTENHIVDTDFTEQRTVSNIPTSVTFDRLPQFGERARYHYDSVFTVPGTHDNLLDHFVIQLNVGLKMVRPISGVTTPRIDAVSKSAVSVGGTRL